jgi:hypothetical protein
MVPVSILLFSQRVSKAFIFPISVDSVPVTMIESMSKYFSFRSCPMIIGSFPVIWFENMSRTTRFDICPKKGDKVPNVLLSRKSITSSLSLSKTSSAHRKTPRTLLASWRFTNYEWHLGTNASGELNAQNYFLPSQVCQPLLRNYRYNIEFPTCANRIRPHHLSSTRFGSSKFLLEC